MSIKDTLISLQRAIEPLDPDLGNHPAYNVEQRLQAEGLLTQVDRAIEGPSFDEMREELRHRVDYFPGYQEDNGDGWSTRWAAHVGLNQMSNPDIRKLYESWDAIIRGRTYQAMCCIVNAYPERPDPKILAECSARGAKS